MTFNGEFILRFLSIATGVVFFLSVGVARAAEFTKSLVWTVEKIEWTQEDEVGFSSFVQTLGEGRARNACRTVDECLKSNVANPRFAALTPSGFKVYSDCADLPFILRGYYAWMNDLPFTYPTEVEKADLTSESILLDPSIVEDLRYTVNGNKIVGRAIVQTGDRVDHIFKRVSDQVSSAMYRVHPHQGVSDDGQFPDFYSVKISRETIVPGTVLYDPAGHVLVVYKVEPNGRIRLIDAHPDNSLTRQIYGDKFMRSSPAAGAGFKAFRPFRVVGKRKLRAADNIELSGYSYEQQYGQRRSRAGWDKGKFFVNKVEMEYYAWVRAKLTVGALVVDALQEFTELMDALCDDLVSRQEAVNLAVWAGLTQKSRPDSLPENIYGTSGEWETYSSPSRDARFKASVKEIIGVAKDMISKTASADKSVIYRGRNLATDLLRVYDQKAKACRIQFQASDGRHIQINLDEVLSRIFDLSFDPYHCPDLRWGLGKDKVSSECKKQDGIEWYLAQAGLRRLLNRNYAMYTGFDLRELSRQSFVGGETSDLSIKRALRSELTQFN